MSATHAYVNPNAHTNPKVVNLTAPVQLSAVGDSKLPTKFSGIAYTGAAVHGYGCVSDMDTITVPQSTALLMSHDRSDIVGMAGSTSRNGYELNVAGDLYSDMPGSSAKRSRSSRRPPRSLIAAALPPKARAPDSADSPDPARA